VFHDGSVMARARDASTLGDMEPITWLVIGLVAGWLAGLVMKGSGYGLVGDIAVGIIGGLLFILIVPIDQRSGLIGTTVVALIGAAIFVGVARVLTRRTVRA
jgi:uncharacterized membrane protein YeaQ/YmgE (transglycosylase-associated protein family)